ncbi:MAG: LacI family DNA-binding transcriptional regulator [Bacteroidota bacterium]|nr:LacI family transcriptional regulator [Odoribacter sp.]MDP3642232.1 LacI family DNA-binding transcriptional regulator [Bacteroidota bacterium]
MRSNQITIKDIARILGISPSTVSRALKDHPDINVDTKKAVNELAGKLKYQPNAVALSLKSSRSNTIGVIIPEIVHYFFSSVISGIEDVASRKGFTVIICQSNESFEREVANARTLLSHRVDGILVSISKETLTFGHFLDLQNSGIPLVFFDRIAPDINADQVIIDDMEASYKATRHLVETGCKRIAHFAGPQNLVIGKDRLQGYLNALTEAGIPVDDRLIVEADTFERARNTVIKMFDAGIIPDGIFAVNDMTAIGAMKTIQKRGYKIPHEISIVGFSDGYLSGITEPHLSSVDQHGYEMGITAAEILFKRILSGDEEYIPEVKVLTADLIVRGSSVKE